MNEHNSNNEDLDLINILLDSGLQDGLHQVAEKLLNAAMILERSTHLQAHPHERSTERQGYANGFKPRTLKTALGQLNLQVPQVRDCETPFRTSLFESGSQIERTLKATIADMYINGVATRKVTKLMETLCGCSVSSTQVSRLTAELDETFETWRNRPLPEIKHLIVDATYYKVRKNAAVRDCALLLAIGVRRDDGRRMVLGVSCALSEAEIHWREFLTSLKERGMGRPDTITSDSHSGLKSALKTVLNTSAWQRCQFHLSQNALHHAPNQAIKAKLGEEIRNVYSSSSLDEATLRLDQLVAYYEADEPKLAKWLEENIPEGLNVLNFPKSAQRLLRTSNMCEHVNMRIRKRTRQVGLFSNEESLLRLSTAILLEISEGFETGRIYLNPSQEN